MLKRDELSNPNSCLNRSKDDEMVFVLLGRDAATPAAIRAWIEKRIELGKNKRDDEQIVEAGKSADNIESDLGQVVQDRSIPCSKCGTRTVGLAQNKETGKYEPVCNSCFSRICQGLA